MLRGEYINGDGRVYPNSLSQEGAKMLLTAALRNTVPAFYFALVSGAPSLDMTMSNMVEPTIGTGGYARIPITRDGAGWPGEGLVGTDRYLETGWLEWAPSGGGFNQPIQRVALVGVSAYAAGTPVWSLSSPLPAPITLTPASLSADKRWKYRIYL